MKVEFQTSFIKAFNKRFANNPSFRNKIEERTQLLSKNPQYPLLHDHALTGKRFGCRSFSITGDIRVIYYIHDGIAYFIDIGTHNQVY